MKLFSGVAGAPGIVCANVLYFKKDSDSDGNSAKEIGIDDAIDAALEKIKNLKEKALNELGEEKAKIFSAYEMLLSDRPDKKSNRVGRGGKDGNSKGYKVYGGYACVKK